MNVDRITTDEEMTPMCKNILTRADVFVIWERNVDYVKCYM